MGANTAGIYGAQIFRADDKPRYRRGFSINIAVLSVGVALAVVRFIDQLRTRRRAVEEEATTASTESTSSVEYAGDSRGPSSPGLESDSKV